MPRKSKAFLRRSAAARKGWRTRRRHVRERNERAKRGWVTRRQNIEFERDTEEFEREPDIEDEDEYVDIIGIDSLYE